MSITDELREYADRLSDEAARKSEHGFSPVAMKLEGIADRIDAEHQKALDEWKAEHDQMWLKGYEECHAELLEGNETIAYDLEGCGLIRLPKDADGEYIHVGDVVDVMPTDKFTGHRDVVVTSVIFKHSAALVTVDTADRPFTFMPNRIRHHHEPTVEDVLREFAEKVIDSQIPGVHPTYEEAIAEYAARLRLAEGVE